MIEDVDREKQTFRKELRIMRVIKKGC